MSKEFDEFMSSMSEIPTNLSNSEKPNLYDVREDDVEKLATEWLQNKLNNVKPTQFCSIDTIREWVEQAKQMELKAKENTYTEEQVREAIKGFDYNITEEQLIKRLKK